MTLARVFVHPSCSWVTSVELSNHLRNFQFSPSFHVNKNGGTHRIFLNRFLFLSLVFLLLLLTHCIFVKNRFVSFQVRFEDMTSVVSSPCNWSLGIQEHLHRRRFNKIPWSGYFSPHFPSKGRISYYNQHLGGNYYQRVRRGWPVSSSAVDDVNDNDPDDSEDGKNKEESAKGEFEGVNGEVVRENLERMVGTDDSAFSGLDLATLIRNKYGRSYDVQLIKKEFLGRNLLALNVMWKYMEQRSFPLTEEEYILRLDDVANTLKCWGAVSHIRNSLAKLKERPRIGKAVSIFIDMDESGGRANEWIYK